MMRFALFATVVAVAAIALTASSPVPAPAAFASTAAHSAGDPWIGKWKSVDTDGSNQTLTITRRGDGAYDVILFDDYASSCGGGTATGAGVGTVSGNTMSGTTTITCADGRVTGTFPFKGTYDAKTDTFTDGLGVVWSRVKTPAPPPRPRGTVPLGRLVLTGAEAPGLTRRTARAASARQALTNAIRPGKLPRIRAKGTQASHFSKRKAELWSIAFVMRNAAAARSATKAIAKAGRGTHVRIGDAGYVLGRRSAVVLWRQGPIVSAIVYTAPVGRLGRRAVALAWGRVAGGRVARAVTATGWTHALRSIGPKGKVSRRLALDLFALAYGPLPGTKSPPGRPGRITDGSLAAQALLRYWRTLTAAQRNAALLSLGLASVKAPLRQGRSPAGHRQAAILGDPGFESDPDLTSVAHQFQSKFQTKFAYNLVSKIVAGRTSTAIAAFGDATSVDEKGNAGGALCRIRLGPNWQKSTSADLRRWVIAYEVFICFEIEIIPFAKKPQQVPWIADGTATWAALWAAPLGWGEASSSLGTSFYFSDCRGSLLARSKDAAFFFGHTQDSLGDLGARMVEVLENADDNLAAFEAAGGSQPQLLGSWASSATVNPGLGWAWTQKSPILPPLAAGCEATPVNGDADLQAFTFGLFPFVIYPGSPEPLLHVNAEPADHARLSDGVIDTTSLHEAWFCLEGDCKCPEGTAGFPPPAPKLVLPAHLAVAGGIDGAKASIRFVSLEQFCTLKQEPPDKPCPLHDGRLAQMIDACPGGGHSPPGPGETIDDDEKPPEPLQCYGHGCAHSAADPHLLPFDSPWYDFQGVGEFTLIRSTSDDLEVQVRQLPWPGSKVVSQNVAVAMKVAGDRVGVYRGNPLVVRVNGRQVLLARKDLRLPRGGTIKPLRDGQVDVVWPDLSAVRVIPTGDLSTDFIVSLAEGRQGKVRGLLGNDDRDSNDGDDFTTRGGRRLDPEAVRGTGKRAYNLLYRVFGESWRVSQKSSLFDYAPGESTKTFTNRRFPARIASPEAIEAGLRKKAEAVCRRMRIKDPRVLRNCILDVSSTGFFSFAVSASTVERSVKKARKAPKPPPPKNPGATVRWAGTSYVYKKQKNQPFDGCSFNGSTKEFEAQFSVSVTTKKGTDAFKLFVRGATKDGTYTNAGVVFIVNQVPILVEQLQVKLAGKRTRGTFSGVDSTPAKQPVTGSFQC
jgi:von Willebrand factor type D domain